jgi:hypothetical protein
MVVMKSVVFWDIMPCSPLKVSRRFGGTYHLYLQSQRINQAKNQRQCRWQAELLLPPDYTLFYCSAYSSTWKLEVICSFETSADFQRTTRHCIPEDSTLQKKSYVTLEHHVTHESICKCLLNNITELTFNCLFLGGRLV